MKHAVPGEKEKGVSCPTPSPKTTPLSQLNPEQDMCHGQAYHDHRLHFQMHQMKTINSSLSYSPRAGAKDLCVLELSPKQCVVLKDASGSSPQYQPSVCSSVLRSNPTKRPGAQQRPQEMLDCKYVKGLVDLENTVSRLPSPRTV